MFTGIIEELGVVKGLLPKGGISALTIEAGIASSDVKIGDSIAVNGVCLTVVKIKGSDVTFELLSETAKLTNLGKLKIGGKVNLERSLKVGGRLNGHFVTGHIDCLGIIRNKGYQASNQYFEIVIAEKFLRYIAPKGSIAVDGISLTVVNQRSNAFNVYIIPHTLQKTTLSFKDRGDAVNIEFDILAKYVFPHC